ncbi:hypothetical protein BGZ95_002179 [Linnemannia exigua]|uniref:DUF323 domain-containing protein n=1 Tax=Linnemannia exigua TaxID=604196 RepID=A0AAD4D5U4_9FUNG|nr:hypothetical protein BGZ95_002179 [Linnemannia exigua]
MASSFSSTIAPTIIDLRQSFARDEKFNAGPDAKRQKIHQDTYPSPPHCDVGTNNNNNKGSNADVPLDLVLENPEAAWDSADSDSVDDMTDVTSLTDETHLHDHPHHRDSSSSSSSSNSGSNNNSEMEQEPAADGGFDLPKMILSSLKPEVEGTPKTIPTMVLYDDYGLQLFDQITYLQEYYLTQEEIEILERDADEIVDHIPDNSVVVELGAGSLRKTVLLLNALERKRKNIRYYALDLMLDELTKSLKSLGQFANVKTAGLWGTYDQGLTFVSSFGSDVPKTLLWLGSSIGNLNRQESQEFIASYRKTLNVGDNWIIGIDRRNDAQEITVAYNDPKGITRDFIMNGLDHINVLLGQEFIDRQKFRYFAQYNVEVGRHEAFYQVTEAHELVYTSPSTAEEIRIALAKDELINVEYSYKWSLQESTQLFEDTQMTKVGQWTSSSNRYDLHLVQKTPFYFKTPTANKPLPSQDEWIELWKSWDLVTMNMIQHPTMLLEKPIALRHPFLFYLGHIPTFLDIQLSRVLQEPFTEPSYFSVIFERGIDPDVEDPTQCHSHSEVPDTWPEVEEIVAFRNRVRERLLKVLNDPVTYPMTRRLARMVFMAFEHEAMHLETIIYMLAQSPNTAPPPAIQAPWAVMKSVADDTSSSKAILSPLVVSPATWFSIDPAQLDKDILYLGHNDLESDDLTHTHKQDLESPFGWDNEHPLVTSRPLPSAFEIQSRQVTNNEYLAYLRATDISGKALLPTNERTPASWLIQDGEVSVKSVYGPVPLEVSGIWPVSCSNLQANGYAAWLSTQHNGVTYTLPTEHELSIAFKLRQATIPKTGLETYGFRQWYPTLDQQSLRSSSSTHFSGPGGLWDWTSTAFAPLDKDGFKISTLYPGYSTDFFDEKHMVVLGASWATHPRIAERRSFRNWYQANYPFVFAGFRLVKRA